MREIRCKPESRGLRHPMFIREFVERTDLDALKKCFIELQNFERQLDPRMPTGAKIADDYIPQMLQRCRQCAGKVLLADVDGEVAGYATILTRVQSEEIGDGDVEFGLVADLVIVEKFRKRGFGKKLLVATESYARECGVKWLRIGVIAGNRAADELYSSTGYSVLYVEREKDLGAT